MKKCTDEQLRMWDMWKQNQPLEAIFWKHHPQGNYEPIP